MTTIENPSGARRIRAASVQFNHKPSDKAANLATVEHFSEQAAAEGAELVVFPEMCITGYWHVRNLTRPEIADLAEPIPDGPSTEHLLRIASSHRLTVGAGLIENAGGRLFNSYVVAMPDGRVERHRKLHTFISEHMSSGDDYTVFDLPQGVRVGVLTCYDNNLGENVRVNALRGVEVLLAPHQTGGCKTPSPRAMGAINPDLWHRRDSDPAAIEAELRGPKGRDWLMKWLPARAHDNGLFLIFSNGVGIDDGEVRTGNAMILDAYGDVLAETCRAGDDMVVADLDLDVRRMCTGWRWIQTRRPELYEELARASGRERETREVRFSETLWDETDSR